mgnify:CR=1 FL=1
MNNLLQDLFNNGSFDNDNNLQEIVNIHLEEYKRLHSLEDLGIDENNEDVYVGFKSNGEPGISCARSH